MLRLHGRLSQSLALQGVRTGFQIGFIVKASVNKATVNKAVEIRVARIKAFTNKAILQQGSLADRLEQEIHFKAYGPRDSGPMNSTSPLCI